MRDGHLKRLRIPIGLILHILVVASHPIWAIHAQQRLLFDGLMRLRIVVVEVHPVHSLGLHQSEAAALEKVHEVLDGTTCERAVAALGLEVAIPSPVHALIRCHAQANHLICLADRQQDDPGHVQQGVTHYPAHPGIAVANGPHGTEKVCWRSQFKKDSKGSIVKLTIESHIALIHVVLGASVQHPGAHNQQHPQESHKVTVVLQPDAVAHPGAVVIKPRYTAITHGAVL